MCCRPASFQAPALPAWKPEEPDSPKVDHDLDGEVLLEARCHCMSVGSSNGHPHFGNYRCVLLWWGYTILHPSVYITAIELQLLQAGTSVSANLWVSYEAVDPCLCPRRQVRSQ